MRAFEYLPYSAVFPRALAVIHQAGIGTLSQALRSGRPQLIVPFAFDQPDNARRAAALGVARVLPARNVRSGTLAAKSARCSAMVRVRTGRSRRAPAQRNGRRRASRGRAASN